MSMHNNRVRIQNKTGRREFLFGLAAMGTISAAGKCAANDAATLRIAHLTDPQLGFGRPEEDHEAVYAADLARFERAVELVNGLKPDLALVTGDMTHRAEEVTRDWPRLVKAFKVPVAFAPGNHDMGNSVVRAKLDRYLSVFGYDRKAFDVKGWRIVVGNTQYWRETELKAERAAYEAWLADELAKAKAHGGRVIVAGHIPPFADAHGEPDSYSNHPLKGREERMSAYLAAGAKFFLAGHTHRMGARGWKGLTILNAETTSRNFDARPHGFRMFEVRGEFDYSYNFVKV